MNGRREERGGPRLLRGSLLAGLSALLTAVGHLAGGATVDDLAALVVLLPPLAAVFVAVAERARGPLGTVAALGAGQLALHYLMIALPAWPGPAMAMAMAMPVGPSMLAAHLVVTLVTAVGLRHADDAVAAVSDALRRVVPRRTGPPPADRPLPTRAVPGPGLPARLAREFAAAHTRRGPPVGC